MNVSRVCRAGVHVRCAWRCGVVYTEYRDTAERVEISPYDHKVQTSLLWSEQICSPSELRSNKNIAVIKFNHMTPPRARSRSAETLLSRRSFPMAPCTLLAALMIWDRAVAKTSSALRSAFRAAV